MITISNASALARQAVGAVILDQRRIGTAGHASISGNKQRIIGKMLDEFENCVAVAFARTMAKT